MKLYLQNIIESIQLESLPSEWLDVDFIKFANKKTLFDYQQKALRNALKALYTYYLACNNDKNQFIEMYRNNGLTENLDLKINGNKKYKIFEEFSNDYEIQNNKIHFLHFINRMSFWMATGSGKTLVIVKLIELLGNLTRNNQIPNNDILFLTYREDLIEQFKNHIDEFNQSNNSMYINLYSLKDYEKVKRDNKIKCHNEIEIFYYRSDLISDEQKDKIIDFRNYDNNGKWYVLLDEAHKGDKEDSKRQIYYSIFSRHGFLFNFSATFTDPIDFATCVYNFNLEKFIQEGYGKHIYISKSDINNLANKNDFDEKQKQVVILKVLLLNTLIKKFKVEGYYHTPLILTLVNSVNTDDSDLYLFFKEIEKIASGHTDNDVLLCAKQELIKDLDDSCEFDNEKIEYDHDAINCITYNDILENIFNAQTHGSIEVLKIPGNKQEIVLKLATSEKAFGLIKIGDISEWLKNKLTGYQIIERFDNESVFRNINNDDSDINILMGSRAFYEGWDSNRPNIILYINIGKGVDARKFVLQSIGRGVRIEPIPNKRKRLLFLYNNNEIDKNEFERIHNNVKFIETLFVFGTKADNLKEIIAAVKEEKQEEIIGDLFGINPDAKDKPLLIPVYKESEKILVDDNTKIKFEINNKDFELIKNYYNYIGDTIALVKYDFQPKILEKIKESFEKDQEFYNQNSNVAVIEKPELLLKKINNHFSLRIKEFKEFKPLENEIIHFKQIRITEKQREKIEQKIKQVLNYKEKDAKLAEIARKIQQEPQKALEYTKEIERISRNYIKESEIEYKHSKIKIKYISNHYYLPLALTESEKQSYILHIIKTKSEVAFIQELENYLQNDNNIFTQFDWWFFSKIDETLDEVYIPYYQPKTNRIEKFKPDFIFWLKKGNIYTILFVDPKGTEHTDSSRKIDGYKRIFTNNNVSIPFEYNGLTVIVQLFLYTQKSNQVIEPYREYWFSKLYEIEKKIRD